MLKIISVYGKGVSVIRGNKENGFIGISPSYPFHSERTLNQYVRKCVQKKRLGEYLNWVKNNLQNTAVFIPDSLLIYNLLAFSDFNKQKAIIESKKANDLFLNHIKKLAESFKVEIITYSSIEKDEDFKKILIKINRSARFNKDFLNECKDLTYKGTRNKLEYIKKNFGRNSFERSLNIAKEYSVKEIAAILFLYKKFPISITKYELPNVIKCLILGDYPEITRDLSLNFGIGHIQLVPENEKVYNELYDDECQELIKDDSS